MKLVDTRTIDGFGRLISPMELRKLLDLREGDSLAIYYVDNNIALLRTKKDTAQE